MNRYVRNGLATLSAVVVLASAATAWAYRQWEQEPSTPIDNAILISKEEHRGGYMTNVMYDPRPIGVPSELWDDSIVEGDTLNMVVKPAFHWFGLRKGELICLSIDTIADDHTDNPST